MKRNTVRMYQMLTHAVDFITRNVGLFPKTAGVASLLKALESVVATLSEQAGILVAAQTATRQAIAAKREARVNLKKYTSRAIQLSRVLHTDSIELPGNASDQRVIDAGKGFLRDAGSMKQEFVDHGLSGKFVEEYASAIEDFEKAIQDYRDAKGQVSSARRIWTDALEEAMDALAHVDFLIANVFENDPATLEAYAVARSLPRGGGRKAATGSPPAAASEPGSVADPAPVPATPAAKAAAA